MKNEIDYLNEHHKLMVPEKEGPKPAAKTYSRFEIMGMLNPFRRLFHSPYKPLAGLIKPGDMVLDLGCGPGFHTLPMARLVGQTGKVIARDLGATQIKWLTKRAAAQGLANRIEARVCTPSDPGLAAYAQQIHLVLVHSVLADVANRLGFFQDIVLALRPYGKLLLMEPGASFTEWRQWIRLAVRAGLTTLEPFDEDDAVTKRKLEGRTITFSKGKPLLRNLSE